MFPELSVDRAEGRSLRHGRLTNAATRRPRTRRYAPTAGQRGTRAGDGTLKCCCFDEPLSA
jgi:hypothetical protein